MKRGELWLAAIFPRSGAEIHGERPVLVMSHDAFNAVPSWRSVIVVPLTTSERQARRGPSAVPIPDGAGGLRGPGVAVCHQLTTIDRQKLNRCLGTLPPEVLASVEAGIRAAVALG